MVLVMISYIVTVRLSASHIQIRDPVLASTLAGHVLCWLQSEKLSRVSLVIMKSSYLFLTCAPFTNTD